MTATMTKHTHPVIFGRKVDGCARCAELAAGAAPRSGWQAGYFARKADAAREANIKHDCKASNCGPVCTWGDW